MCSTSQGHAKCHAKVTPRAAVGLWWRGVLDAVEHHGGACMLCVWCNRTDSDRDPISEMSEEAPTFKL